MKKPKKGLYYNIMKKRERIASGSGERMRKPGLSAYLLRAIGDSGHLHSFEVREEFAQIAKANVANFLDGEPKNWTVRIGKPPNNTNLTGRLRYSVYSF